MRWCDPYWLDCGRWVCSCSHLKSVHALGVCMEDECSCDSFSFKNNNNCTLECQMKYLLEKNK